MNHVIEQRNEGHRPGEPTGGETRIGVGVDRGFGLAVAGAFAAIGLWPIVEDGDARIWAGVLALALAVTAVVSPRALRPVTRLCYRLAMALLRFAAPLLLGLLFYLAVTPAAMMMRLLGRRPLNLDQDPDAQTYWIDRTPPGPDRDSMRRQA